MLAASPSSPQARAPQSCCMTSRAQGSKHYAPHPRRRRLVGTRRQNGSVKLNAIWVVPKHVLILLPTLAEPPITHVDDLDEAQQSPRFTNENVVWNPSAWRGAPRTAPPSPGHARHGKRGQT